MTPDGWHKIDRGLFFESADSQWRIVYPGPASAGTVGAARLGLRPSSPM